MKNREIKFRAWDSEMRVMITPFIDFLNFEESPNYRKMNVLHQNFDEYEEFVPTEIMQFTGLKDKNGKEIYEGDIVFQTGMGNNTVVYCEEVACFGYRSKTGIKPFSLVPVLKVIGNLYENPDLL